LHFGDYELDLKSGKLLRDGSPVKIQPQPLRVLCALVEQRGQIVSRDHLRSRIWDEATYVEFDEGLNYCIRQIRVALGDKASDPLYIETLPKQGYRFIAQVEAASNGLGNAASVEQEGSTGDFAPDKNTSPASQNQPSAPALPGPTRPIRRAHIWLYALGLCAFLALAGFLTNYLLRTTRRELKYTQLTDFTDSAVAPALSPDGHTLAFIRGSNDFLTADQIYEKLLPNGEAKRITDDSRLKYHLAFSPDGSQISYTVLDPPNFATYSVPVLGGASHLLLNNAAGLTWLDQQQLLFSEIRSGIHMGAVTGTLAREHFRDLYFPAHERGMVHYSYASPNRKSALLVEMDPQGKWSSCRLISLTGQAQPKLVGPSGLCASAGWSPDGSWMYFTAYVQEQSHLWRQRFPNGRPEQITFGPTEEKGVAVEPDGRSIITSMGLQQSSIWIHDERGERSLSSEGEILNRHSPPIFSADGKILYYLLRRQSANSSAELWRMTVQSGESEAVLPGINMLGYDISPDGKWVVFSQKPAGEKSELWLAPIDRSSPPRPISRSGETYPHFGPPGRIVFLSSEGNFNYLEQMNQDGSARSKVFLYPITDIVSVSPGRRWVVAMEPFTRGAGGAIVAIPVTGGPARTISQSYCIPIWSPNGKFLFVPVEAATRTSPGRSLAIPLGPGEALPAFPPGGITPHAEPSAMPGAQSIGRADLIPGEDLNHFAYVNTTVHRNLYRISLPQ
jgi:Tol biopolymer transport system component/DNA-binding winged helix-turn-helix (wHTH) protein